MRKINFSSQNLRLALATLIIAIGAGALIAYINLSAPLAISWQDAILNDTELPKADLEDGDPNKDGLVLLALAEDRGDAVVRLLNNGVDPNISENIVLWGTLKDWTLENSERSEQVIAAYAQNGGEFNVTLHGMTPMEAASTVSLAAMGALMDNGVSPWTNPESGPGILTRLSLHSELPNVLTIIEHVVMNATTHTPDVWERDVVVGNLVDHYDRLRAEGVSHGLDENGHITGTPDEAITQIARIVLHIAHENEGPWHLIPQEFLDLEKANLI